MVKKWISNLNLGQFGGLGSTLDLWLADTSLIVFTLKNGLGKNNLGYLILGPLGLETGRVLENQGLPTGSPWALVGYFRFNIC